MTNTINVSIIVPIYNTEEYLEDCLSSIVNQSLNNIEIILVNDGSTDGSADIIESYHQKYPKCIRVFHQKNQGQASARNLGIEKATGKFIGFVDSDDTIIPEMFEKMYLKAEEEEADMVECDYRYCKIQDGQNVAIKKYGTIKERNNSAELFIDPLVSPWNKLFRKSLLDNSLIRFPEGLIYEDTAFYIELIPWINRISFVSEVLVLHYSRENSTQTKKNNPKLGDMLIIIEQIIKYYQLNKFWSQYQQELEYFCVKILLGSSLGRIALLGNKEMKKKTFKQIFTLIEQYFPNYRKNKYIKYNFRGIYLKSCTKRTLPIFASFLGAYYNWKMN